MVYAINESDLIYFVLPFIAPTVFALILLFTQKHYKEKGKLV